MGDLMGFLGCAAIGFGVVLLYFLPEILTALLSLVLATIWTPIRALWLRASRHP